MRCILAILHLLNQVCQGMQDLQVILVHPLYQGSLGSLADQGHLCLPELCLDQVGREYLEDLGHL